MICNLPCRIVLIAMNSVSLIVGLALLIVGALMVWGQSVIQSLLNNFITNLINQYIQGSSGAQINELVTRILTSTSPVGMAVFILGCVCAGISLFGYCGACCNMKILLYIYAILVGILALAFLVTFSVYFSRKDEIGNKAIELFQTSVTNYQSMVANNLDSLVIGLILPPLKCCGVDSGEDFTKSTNFWRNDTYGGKSYTNIKYPVPCCKMTSEYVIIDSSCPTSFTTENSYYNVGCRGPLKELFLKYMDYVAYGLIAAFVLLSVLDLFVSITICIDVI